MSVPTHFSQELSRALVVDDDRFSRSIMKRRLNTIGVTVLEASDGVEALRMLETHSIDLVLLDLEMPRVDGFSLLGILRGHPKHKHLPVIVLTGDESRAASERALTSGATSFLVKPLNWSAFGPHIKHIAQLVGASRIAIENMGHGLALYEQDGSVSLRNEEYSNLMQADPKNESQIDKAVFQPDWISEKQKRVKKGEFIQEITELPEDKAISSSFRPLPGGGWLEVHQDISEQRRASKLIDYLAYHDPLTGLANRSSFQKMISYDVARAKRGEMIAVLYLDLDHFKPINDTLGHLVGDKLLKQVGQRLQAEIREIDKIARIGGDEFAIIQVASVQPAGASSLASRLIDTIRKPFEIDGHRLSIGCSIGIALSPQDSDDPAVLLRNADLAMYRSKSEGRSKFSYFEPTMDAAMQERRQLEMDLRHAVSQKQFELHYQPQIDLEHDCLNSFEALIRWNHPTRGRVAPLDFIPLAEEIGVISEIGSWVLEQACKDASLWPDSVSVAVNASPLQFKGHDLPAAVGRALEASQLPAERLQIEITESALLQGTDHTLSILGEIQSLGVQIAMDDFGTGYSSLNYLRQFPFDKIKIDKCFIDQLAHDKDSVTIVRAVADLAAGLGIRTTAEGVETSDQREILQRLGCNEVQGYLISRPRPLAEIGEWFDNSVRLSVVPLNASSLPAERGALEPVEQRTKLKVYYNA